MTPPHTIASGQPYRAACGTRSRLRVALERTVIPRTMSRTFWDTHAATLEHHIVPHRPYHSYIEGDHFQIETDADGRPILIELDVRHCLIHDSLSRRPDLPVEESVPRFLDVRINFRENGIWWYKRSELIYIALTDVSPTRLVRFSPGSTWGFDSTGNLCGIWLIGIMYDPSGSMRMMWRREAWLAARKARQHHTAVKTRFSPISVPGLRPSA